jgi:signal transduction histidine kinase/DNA-binding response OmpR family regulator
MAPIQLLIVDDHEAVRNGLHSLLAAHRDFTICGQAADGVEAVAQCKLLLPDLVLMDVSMPRMDGLTATRAILADLPDTKIIIISQNDPGVMTAEAKKAGAAAFVGKANLARELIPTIKKILNGTSPQPGKKSRRATSRPAMGWVKDEGEMASLIRSANWSETPLGRAESWSSTLRTMLNFLLANRFPQLLWWGPEFCCIYNDAYIPILGTKHPSALGRPVAEVWHEIWDVLRPLIETPFRGGPATWAEDIELSLNRRGYREETHFTIAYSPVPDDTADSGIGGVLATVHETTEKMIGERRIAALRELGSASVEAKSANVACRNAVEILSRHKKDTPFVMLYLLDPNGERAALAGSHGVSESDPGCPGTIGDVHSHENPWPVAAMIASEKIEFVGDITRQFASLPGSAWDEPVTSAAILPIRSNIAHHLAGFMITGLSPRSQFDESYRNFLELMSTQIATTVANARAYEEERKRSQALAEIDRAKTAFFSNVSHEFRTPLTLMLGPLEELLARSHTDLSPAAKSQLELVNRNGVRLLRLVNTLLDFSRIEAGRVQASYQPTDLAAFTTDLASVFRSATERAGLELKIECPALPAPVYVDRDMWEKIVLNLVSNAFKFTFEGEIRIHLEQQGDAVELQVTDTGVGIPADEMPRLFERFHRVDNTRSRTHEGSGIGLALVYELVRLHGGFMRAESEEGSGSTFFIRIPTGKHHLPADQIGGDRALASTAIGANPFVEEAVRWLPDDTSPDNSEFATVPDLLALPYHGQSDADASRPQVLVVDDNADMRNYLARLLKERYDVVAVADGQEALRLIRARRPDLVVSDIMMPNLDGIGLMKELRSDPVTETLPIILLSARAGEEARVEGLRAGADDYLVKPFSARELLARVGALLTITQLRSTADKALRESEERLRALIYASSYAVYRMSPDWKVMRQLDGKGFIADRADPTNDWMGGYIPAEEQPRVLRAIQKAIETKSLFSLEHQVKRPDGAIGWTSSRAIPLLDEQGDIIEWFGAASDITARREVEEKYRKLAQSLDVEVRERTKQLESRNSDVIRQSEQLRDLSYRLMQTQDEERRHIARELHDSAGQTLAALGMHLAQIARGSAETSPHAAKEIESAQELLQQLQKEIRTTSYLLHPPLLDEMGLSSALAWYIEGLQERSGLQIDLSIPENFGRIPRDLELVIFRLVQECLTNIHRHSGATRAAIRVERLNTLISVQITDNGHGMPPEKLSEIQSGGYGVGLRGMRERVRQFHGEMRIESETSGTRILVVIPFSKAGERSKSPVEMRAN